MDVAALYEQFASRPEGLSAGQAQVRLKKHGPNVLAQDQRPGIATILFHSVLNPIVILLAVTVVGYAILTHSVKIWMLRKNWI